MPSYSCYVRATADEVRDLASSHLISLYAQQQPSIGVMSFDLSTSATIKICTFCFDNFKKSSLQPFQCFSFYASMNGEHV